MHRKEARRLHAPSKAHKWRMLRKSCVSELFPTSELVAARLDGPLLRSDVCPCLFACIDFVHRSRSCSISTHLSFEVSRRPSYVCDGAHFPTPCLLVASSLACLHAVSPRFASDVHELQDRTKVHDSCARNVVDGPKNAGDVGHATAPQTCDECRWCVEARSVFFLLLG